MASGSHTYTCGHCGVLVSGEVVAGGGAQLWLRCAHCSKGSYIDNANKPTPKRIYFPSPKPGQKIEGLPSEVKVAYDEARDCMSMAAYTAASLLCRKILMYVACQKKAEEGKSFAYYIDYLADQGYVTRPMKSWVKLIKNMGNDATHKLEPPGKEKTEAVLSFTAQLLISIYEMEHLAKKHMPSLKEPQQRPDA